tara:strand:- start:132 stop:257 length:126 start_codon:yes stop_codon:yes gene_type:complete
MVICCPYCGLKVKIKNAKNINAKIEVINIELLIIFLPLKLK